jgi:Ca2+-binding EF-hand superfamily protein
MGSSESKADKLPEELSDEQLDDISKNTGLPIHDIAQWYQRFYDFSNGKDLDKKHFKKYFKELLPNDGNSDKFCDLAFFGIFYMIGFLLIILKNLIFIVNKAFDTNSNQKIDYSEIIIGFSHIYKPDLNNRLMWMFRLYDQNKDGYIDHNELRTTIKVSSIYSSA